ncbi:MAG: LPS assembly lipoprotein LptE [Lentisphaeria bacterium]
MQRKLITPATLLVAFGFILSISGGCNSYNWGYLNPPQIRTIAIGDFNNRTDEPALAILLRKKMAEHVTRDGSLQLADRKDADMVLEGTIESYDFRRAGAAKLRDEDAIEEDRSAYRSSIYSAELQIRFSGLLAEGGKTVIADRKVRGKAEFAEMPDLTIARQSGLQQAANAAAKKIITAVTEGW